MRRILLTRAMIILGVSLSIEALVAVFQFLREDPSELPYAAAIGSLPGGLMVA